ncbi:uncharacterized protein K452DRAFT_320240 [Aplosporella prunicola CBS 121167]|uniref:Uncharacterized protein n=1 Tax=Aplosporella prunicola CBS 121167 TaxID=1176127 RepID=A0A6A6B7P1_9PEZI|nr:uncharacterized protein K452DRAFT_320240 [Aplosporella prunicola CBS 121167]KAF2139588.1 hypothetical protein K452DRAFT_320240 [Aplosporella prunicola CBS 121167]
MPTTELSPTQAHALFDVLTHQEVYSEILNFKWPEAIHRYGHPFVKDASLLCTSPILQSLLNKFALTLPGLSSVDDAFWKERISTIVEKFGAAELSESYDKGSIGLRKTLATAISALIEYPAKGALGGFPMKDVQKDRKYDISKPDDVLQAWDVFLQQLVYGDMVDLLFKKCAETNKLEEHPNVVQAAHEFILVNLATLLHQIFILSPDGQSLLRIMENINRLIPYSIIRQTLKVGNAATMINGMVRLVLAKLSVGTITNWIGISKGADEGMNLLQQIISTVLSWDSSELQKQATKIEKSKNRPDKDHLEAIKKHLQTTREERSKRRNTSMENSKSIVGVIFEANSLSSDIPESQQLQALDYLSAQLSVRDREQLIQILCRQQPDHLTQAIRDLVAAYDPIIRAVHNAYDLSAGITDLENFLDDLIKLSKLPSSSKKDNSHVKDTKHKTPSVEDFVNLLKKHQGSCHRFLHSIAKNGPEVTEWFRQYALKFMSEFQRSSSSPEGAGAMNSTLNSLFKNLSPEDQQAVSKALDAHSDYLSKLSATSSTRMKSILSKSENTDFGPGMYIAKWQALIEATPITPSMRNSPLRSGKSKDVKEAAQVDVDGERKGVVSLGNEPKGKEILPEPPNVDIVWKLLGPEYRKALAGGISNGGVP